MKKRVRQIATVNGKSQRGGADAEPTLQEMKGGAPGLTSGVVFGSFKLGVNYNPHWRKSDVEARPKKVVHYITSKDADPFADWMEEIDGKAFDIVNIRLKRVGNGNFGDAHGVGDGVSELVIDFGPGYRVYFGQDGDMVLLLTGGTKRTQTKDIARAKVFWKEYNSAGS
jgi:putative addiction module killer protein